MSGPHPDDFRAKVFPDRKHPGDWRVEKQGEDGESIEIAIFSGGDERQRAIRYANREYGAFDEIELEPYRRSSEKSGSPPLDRPGSELGLIRETVGDWLRSDPAQRRNILIPSDERRRPLSLDSRCIVAGQQKK
jgi:hypothetical protein